MDSIIKKICRIWREDMEESKTFDEVDRCLGEVFDSAKKKLAVGVKRVATVKNKQPPLRAHIECVSQKYNKNFNPAIVEFEHWFLNRSD